MQIKLSKTAAGYGFKNEEVSIVVTPLSDREARSLGSDAGCRWKVDYGRHEIKYFKTLRAAKNHINR